MSDGRCLPTCLAKHEPESFTSHIRISAVKFRYRLRLVFTLDRLPLITHRQGPAQFQTLDVAGQIINNLCGQHLEQTESFAGLLVGR
jgi:hypothetical protein